MWRNWLLLGLWLCSVGCSKSPAASGELVSPTGTPTAGTVAGATAGAGASAPAGGAAGTATAGSGAGSRLDAAVPPAAGSGGGGGGDKADAATPAKPTPNPDDDLDAGSEDASTPDAAQSGDPTEYVVGTRRLELTSGNRTLPLQLWYPALESARAAAEAGRPLSEFEPVGEQRTQLEMLLVKAPETCVTKTMHAADAPAPLARSEAFPLVLLSHCHGGARFGMFTIAELLVRKGFVVAALDHVDDTIYEQLAGTIVLPLGDEVERRFADLTHVLDVLLDPNATLLPEGLRGKLDAQRVGIVGHSIGSITTGRFTWAEPRVKASVFIAAPPTVPLLSPAVLADFKAPALFVYASEDNSIPVELNALILTDHEDFPQPAWLVALTDAGHFAFSDLVGIMPELGPGCGEAARQTDPRAMFTYLDPKLVRELTSTYVGAFLERTLLKGPGEALDKALNPKVMLKHHD